MSTQKIRPILMSTPMIQALLGCRKTQTRRVIKNLPMMIVRLPYGLSNRIDFSKCPYGARGDLLWVRESFFSTHKTEEYTKQYGRIEYRATANPDYISCVFKPSIHMPKWASRITLKITDIRVEQLQDISAQDVIAEGIEPIGNSSGSSIKGMYRNLWGTIHGADSWDANPWVWVIEFKVHRINIDEFLCTQK